MVFSRGLLLAGVQEQALTLWCLLKRVWRSTASRPLSSSPEGAKPPPRAPTTTQQQHQGRSLLLRNWNVFKGCLWSKQHPPLYSSCGDRGPRGGGCREGAARIQQPRRLPPPQQQRMRPTSRARPGPRKSQGSHPGAQCGEEGGRREEENHGGEHDTIEGILQLSAGPEGSGPWWGAPAGLKGVGGEGEAGPEVYSEGKGLAKCPRSKGKLQKKRSFGAVSKSEEAEDETGSEAEEASLPLSTLLAHRTTLRPEPKAAGAPGAVKAEPGVESAEEAQDETGRLKPPRSHCSPACHRCCPKCLHWCGRPGGSPAGAGGSGGALGTPLQLRRQPRGSRARGRRTRGGVRAAGMKTARATPAPAAPGLRGRLPESG